MSDEYWLEMLGNIFDTILESAKTLDNKLPPEGFQELCAIKFDAGLGQSIVKDMKKNDRTSS